MLKFYFQLYNAYRLNQNLKLFLFVTRRRSKRRDPWQLSMSSYYQLIGFILSEVHFKFAILILQITHLRCSAESFWAGISQIKVGFCFLEFQKLKIAKLPQLLQLNQQMSVKSSKWSPQEEDALRFLKEQQNQTGEVSWEKIAIKLNQCFLSNKTPKQCREKFINHLKFGEKALANLQWAPSDIQRLMQLYAEHGPSWIAISQFFPNKSENTLKNKFNNSIRKAAKILHDFESRENAVSRKRSITAQLLISMMDLANQLHRKIVDSQSVINQDSNIFRFRRTLLQLCFKPDEYGKEQIKELVRLIKSINIKLRCFGVFKVKNRKQWKITKRSIDSICQFDKITLEETVRQDSQPNSNQSLVPSGLSDLESLIVDPKQYQQAAKATLEEQAQQVLGCTHRPTFFQYLS